MKLVERAQFEIFGVNAPTKTSKQPAPRLQKSLDRWLLQPTPPCTLYAKPEAKGYLVVVKVLSSHAE